MCKVREDYILSSIFVNKTKTRSYNVSGLVGWLAGVDFPYRWVVEGQGHDHGQGHIRRGLRTLCGLAVGGGPILIVKCRMCVCVSEGTHGY